jgi:hypothetical protein
MSKDLRFGLGVLVGMIMAVTIVALSMPVIEDQTCPKNIYAVNEGGIAFARDCNDHEWRGIPPRYGVIRVWQVGEVLE